MKILRNVFIVLFLSFLSVGSTFAAEQTVKLVSQKLLTDLNHIPVNYGSLELSGIMNANNFSQTSKANLNCDKTAKCLISDT